MIKKSQYPSIVAIVINTIAILILFAVADLPKVKNVDFESLILLFVYFFWMIVFSAVDFLVALVLFLAKSKEYAMACVVGGVYMGTIGPIAIFAYTYIRMVMN